MDLSIIILSYKCKHDIRVALEAVFASQTFYSYEVILIDNASDDGTVEMLQQEFLSRPEIAAKLTFIKNAENVGFGRGNNQGMRLATGDHLLLLNSDTKMASDNIQIMMDFIRSRPDIGIATCKLIKANGDLDWACRRTEPDPWVSFYRLIGLQKLFPNNPRFAAYNILHKSIDEETEVDACVGAYMLMPRQAYEKVGGFDEAFFMYGEDLDLCRRMRDAGYTIWYYPKTMSYHFKGQSSKKTPQRSLHAFHDAMWIYYKKHYYKKYNALMNGLVYLGIWLRYYWISFLNLFKAEKVVSR
jgi:GT2 family glycosyltransferase